MAGFYRLHPNLDRRGWAKLQLVVWALGAAVLGIAVGLIHSGQMIGEPLAGVAAIALFLSMMLFVGLVFQATGRKALPAARAVPPAAE